MIKACQTTAVRLDSCYLTKTECVGLLMQKVAEDERSPRWAVINSILEGPWKHRYDIDKKMTEFKLGRSYKKGGYRLCAKFTLDSERTCVLLELRDLDSDQLYLTKFVGADLHDIVYLAGYSLDDEWGYK